MSFVVRRQHVSPQLIVIHEALIEAATELLPCRRLVQQWFQYAIGLPTNSHRVVNDTCPMTTVLVCASKNALQSVEACLQ